MQIDTSQLILIVTGAHLQAEVGDRPVAYGLRQRLLDWMEERGMRTEPGVPRVLVCSDLWYLNNDPLRVRPTISIGGPGVNALTAFLADKLPSAFAIEDQLIVQADLDFHDCLACCWGANTGATSAAVQAFCDRYLDAFMEAAQQRMPAEEV
jgi:hypothetical protein